jgi:hypothetical protein
MSCWQLITAGADDAVAVAVQSWPCDTLWCRRRCDVQFHGTVFASVLGGGFVLGCLVPVDERLAVSC